MTAALQAVIAQHRLAVAGAAPAAATAIALMVHGRGATAASILQLADVLALPGLCCLAPQADGNSWYPQSFMAPTAANEPFLGRALGRLSAIIADLLSSGVAPAGLGIVGFSQGACLASETVLRNPRAYGFIGVLSGGAIGPPGTPRDYPGSLAGARVFVGCSDHDPHIPLARVRETSALFRRMGASVTEHVYPGASHGISPHEVSQLREGLSGLAARHP